MLKKLTAVLMIAISISLFSAEKYAVLIAGDYYSSQQGASTEPQKEFWYDTFLMWEMLVTKMGYSHENIHVLFADGIDFWKVDGVLYGAYVGSVA